jgi:hypothetical protein
MIATTDYPLIRKLPNGCQVRVVWTATERRYRAELTLPDGEVKRNSAGPPDGVAKLLAWSMAEAEKVTPVVMERTIL